jgi:DNA-binding transcriptional MerR regulator
MADTDASYTIAEVAAAAGVAPRTIRHWVRERLLPAPPFRGAATTYDRERFVRARAIARWRAQGLRLRAIRQRLAATPLAELERLVAPTPSPDAPRVPPPPPTYPAEAWERVVLLPGLELHVRPDASLALRRIAQDIYTHYGPPGAVRVAEPASAR